MLDPKELKKTGRRALTFRLCGYRCFYCGRKPKREPLTLDHKTPKCRGGTNELENLVAACSLCNGEKGNGTVEEYRAQLRRRKGRGYIFWGERDPETAARLSYRESRFILWLTQLTPLAQDEDYDTEEGRLWLIIATL